MDVTDDQKEKWLQTMHEIEFVLWLLLSQTGIYFGLLKIAMSAQF